MAFFAEESLAIASTTLWASYFFICEAVFPETAVKGDGFGNGFVISPGRQLLEEPVQEIDLDNVLSLVFALKSIG